MIHENDLGNFSLISMIIKNPQLSDMAIADLYIAQVVICFILPFS